MLIAAHILAGDLTLVTGNEREFGRGANLRVEDWLTSWRSAAGTYRIWKSSSGMSSIGTMVPLT